MTGDHLSLRLTPPGKLLLDAPSDDARDLDASLARRLSAAWDRGAGYGLLQLAGPALGQPLPPVFSYWRDLATAYITRLCTTPDIASRSDPSGPPSVPPPAESELHTLALGAPAMPGAEYVTAGVLASLWRSIDAAFHAELIDSGLSVQGLLAQLNPAWHVVGRVHFNLAEQRGDDRTPFAFLATYTTGLSRHGKAQHLPLGDALHEYAGAANRDRLLSLLLPVQAAAERCDWLREMVDSREIFHPLRWTVAEASRLLHDLPALEQAGVLVRTPSVWGATRPPRPQVTATLGARPPGGVGAEAMLDFHTSVILEGQPLSTAEVAQLLASTMGLAMIRGRWVEVDPDRLREVMERFADAERLASKDGLSLTDAMRMLSGADITGSAVASRADTDWGAVTAGPWLAETLRQLRAPESRATRDDVPRDLHGTLRPYQQTGVRWLTLLSELRLGACLADDMGLGKTIQVLGLLLLRRRQRDGGAKTPSLLVAPASLLANWSAEIERFAPTLRTLVAHQSAMTGAELRDISAEALAGVDLVISTYGSLQRFGWLAAHKWDVLVLDEAQAIKNPNSKQTRAAKALSARTRIALTGTPVENRLSDLWSIFDFINPGLLGSAKQFSAYSKRMAAQPHNPYGKLRDLVRPYILRRLKTDRAVISDLPDKTELKAYCRLTRRQAALYQQAVDQLAKELGTVKGIRRRGIVLAFLMRFKQICNHPSHWLGDGAWNERESGKWERLGELAEVIAAKQEKALVFTQFREMADPLAAYLGQLFGRPGLVMHGETPVAKRRALVARFQEDDSVPFFVLSLKVGGTGLNLTAASHVIHVDRWWNPAVENQATDRAFRIGQTRNVLVHKFVCRGTVEEKIDTLIESKASLSRELLDGTGEMNLTEMSDAELLRLVALDVSAAMGE